MLRSAPILPIAYLIGTFPTAAIVARRKGADIHSEGSGNPGASNATRVLGWKTGVLVLLVDVLKGAAPAGLGLWLDGRAGAWALGAAATIGHIWPAQRRFRGGKGVATAGGMVWVIEPLVAAAIILAWGVIAKFTHKASLASLFAIVAVPIAIVVRGRPAWEFGAACLLAGVIIVRHRENLLRLLKGSEPKLSQ